MSDWRSRLVFLGIFSTLFVFVFGVIAGWRLDHTMLLGLICILTLAHRYGYMSVLALTGVIFWVMLYDLISYYPNYQYQDVSIKSLYDLELSFFGISDEGKIISMCEWFSSRTTPLLTVFFGFSYLLWVPAPLIFSLYIAYKDKEQVVDFAFAYMLTNVIGVIGYYIYPAAPPWYYLSHGDIFDPTMTGSAGLFVQFDDLTGTTIFQDIYAKGKNIYAAIPSLHASYPLLGLIYAHKWGYKAWTMFFIIMSVGTWVGAIYSQHHYIIDVVLGILAALVGFGIISWFGTSRPYARIKDWYKVQFQKS